MNVSNNTITFTNLAGTSTAFGIYSLGGLTAATNTKTINTNNDGLGYNLYHKFESVTTLSQNNRLDRNNSNAHKGKKLGYAC